MSDTRKRMHSILQENEFEKKNHILHHVGAIQQLIASWT